MAIVRYIVDLNNPPPLTAKQEAELKALAAMPDSEIDFSDIPPLSEEFWRNAVRNPYLRPRNASAELPEPERRGAMEGADGAVNEAVDAEREKADAEG